MIISHEMKLIFIKTKKVGGTSFEMALSRYCGDDDVITPIIKSDEQQRRGLGYKGAQNYKNTVWRDWGVQTDGEFFNHIAAPAVKASIPPDVWTTYRKIAIYRNPFDVAISRYFWEGGEQTRLSFEQYLTHFPQHLRENTTIAPLTGAAVLDSYLRYEHLQAELESIGLGFLWDTFSSIRAKANLRPKTGASVTEIFSAYPNAISIVERECADELRFFGYRAPELATRRAAGGRLA